MLTALAITASSFAAMVIPASAEPDDPATPTWQLGAEGTTPGEMETITYAGKDDVLHVSAKNVFAPVSSVSSGTVTINTDVYTDPSVGRTFRIMLQSDDAVVYDTAKAFAQVAANNTSGLIYAGGDSATANDNAAIQFQTATAGWYNVNVVVDYNKKDAADFITVSVKDSTGAAVGTTQNVPAFADVDTTLKAIRLVSTQHNDTYFANFTVTPGSVLTPAEPVATAEPTEEPEPTATPGPTKDPSTVPTTEYYNDNFDSYDSTGLAGQGTAEQTGTLGKLNTAVGARGSGGDNTSTLSIGTAALDGNETKYLTFVSGGTATSQRGASVTFNDECAIPAFAALDGQLDIDFDMYFADAASTLQFFGITSSQTSSGGEVVNDPYLSAANNANIPLTQWVNVNMQINSAKNVNLSITDKDGKLLDAKSFTAAGDAVGKIAAYGAASSVSIDNLVVKQVGPSNYANATVTVKQTDGTAVEGATVKLDSFTLPLTDATGVSSAIVPIKDAYAVTVSKDAYEATEGEEDNFEGTIEVTAAGGTADAVINPQVYTAVPGSVTIKDGQGTVSAAAGDTPNTSAAFTTEVIDQKNIPVESGYTTEWSIFPTGTTTANPAVTIADGVVSVSKDFKAAEGKDVEVFDVIAKVTLNGESKEATTTVNIANSDIITYDSATVYTPSGRSQTFTLPSVISMPETGKLRIAFDFIPGTLGSDSNAQATTAFKSSNGAILFGLQNTKEGLFAFTANSISTDCNGSGDTKNFTDFASIGTVDSATTYPVEFSVIGSKLVVNFNGQFFTLPFSGATDLSINRVTIGNYRQTNAFGMTVKNLLTASSVNVDENAMDIDGDATVAKIQGKTVTREYKAVPTVDSDGETFTWSMEPATYEGVTLSAEGVLSITDAAAPGTVKIIAVSSASNDKKGELEVAIADYQELTLKADGPLAYNNKAGDKGQYVITSAVDGCDDEVKDVMPAPVWTSSDEGVATIDAASGELTVVAAGTTTVTATVTNGTAVSKVDIPVIVAAYYITADVAADSASTEVDLKGIVAADKYLVTTADADGNLVKQEEVDAPSGIVPPTSKTVAAEAGVKITATYTDGVLTSVAEPVAVAAGDEIDMTAAEGSKVFYWKSLASVEPLKTETKTEEATGATTITVDTTGAAKVEVAPIFNTHIAGNSSGHVVGETIAIPADTYNFAITNASGVRGDIYANEQMLVNNLLQGGNTVTSYTAHDIVVKEGYVTIQTYDDTGVAADISITKAPSIVTRVPKMYTLGDSLVCIYYNGGSPDNKLAQTGWGQVLQDYITDDVEVVDLGNSGVTAPGLYSSAFTQVRESAQAGDYLVLESGYNDKTYETEDKMKTAVRNMVNEAREKGVEVVLVSPNASHHDYNGSVAWTSYMEDLVKELDTKYIDLSQLSFDFLSGLYGTGTDTKFTQEFALATWNVSDRLHSTYNAANKWASIVATELGKLYPDANLVNTEHEYTFQDTADPANTITCKVSAE